MKSNNANNRSQSSQRKRRPMTNFENQDLSRESYPFVSENKLSYWMKYLENRRRSNLKKGNRTSAQVAEIEICYVFRELEIRRYRREIHEKYMREKNKNKFQNRAKTQRNRV